MVAPRCTRAWVVGLTENLKTTSDEIRILAPGMEIMRETPWSRNQGQNSVYKEFLAIVGNGSPTGSVLEETIAVPPRCQ